MLHHKNNLEPINIAYWEKKGFDGFLQALNFYRTYFQINIPIY